MSDTASVIVNDLGAIVSLAFFLLVCVMTTLTICAKETGKRGVPKHASRRESREPLNSKEALNSRKQLNSKEPIKSSVTASTETERNSVNGNKPNDANPSGRAKIPGLSKTASEKLAKQ